MAFMDWFKGKQIPKQWHTITSKEDVNRIMTQSNEQTVAIFKHSTRCGISHSVLNHLIESLEQADEQLEISYLDLIKYREVSDYIRDQLEVAHQSPQLIIIRDNKAIYHSSHHAIRLENILSEINI